MRIERLNLEYIKNVFDVGKGPHTAAVPGKVNLYDRIYNDRFDIKLNTKRSLKFQPIVVLR